MIQSALTADDVNVKLEGENEIMRERPDDDGSGTPIKYEDRNVKWAKVEYIEIDWWLEIKWLKWIALLLHSLRRKFPMQAEHAVLYVGHSYAWLMVAY